ncbi:GAF and ANTAR domain-containing protein [Haloechinothrix sp. YIM 98757]|uniref:GAF and ANTAR domain-containing protein n=1 Tax=Haloechinothrix aidingensis TaxID=2752311 RepID=A0A838AEB6_9PSEU|nr:GAF and ANTAR domain-containing protein [Haloechinothrix aidingensis]MBA0127468.1 GAF and ANTAR domain-containing protein [Haloechinothrix aidingensis]
MSPSDRAVRNTFVELADTFVVDFDIMEFLNTLALRTTELLDITACGVVLVNHNDTLNAVAASTEQTRLLELLESQNEEGPCLDCYRGGAPVQCADLGEADALWPTFAPAARDAGFSAVEALPMRLREDVIGAVNLFNTSVGGMDSDTLELGQALASTATIGILHERATHRRDVLVEQLQTALDSRVLIEQAKGVYAERNGVSVEVAFAALRSHARSTNSKLIAVANQVIDGTLTRLPHERVQH